MAETSEYRTHPVLGALAWLPKHSHWFAQHRLASGGMLDVIVSPRREDRHEFLPQAAELFRWAMGNERRLFWEALRAYLLELYNDGWRQDDEPVLLEDEFAAQLEWQLLEIKASDIVPVEFWYDAGDLFGGHGVVIQVGAELQYRSANLVG